MAAISKNGANEISTPNNDRKHTNFQSDQNFLQQTKNAFKASTLKNAEKYNQTLLETGHASFQRGPSFFLPPTNAGMVASACQFLAESEQVFSAVIFN